MHRYVFIKSARNRTVQYFLQKRDTVLIQIILLSVGIHINLIVNSKQYHFQMISHWVQVLRGLISYIFFNQTGFKSNYTDFLKKKGFYRLKLTERLLSSLGKKLAIFSFKKNRRGKYNQKNNVIKL
ncbi:hypothetical protein HZS_4262 [Henneguya salminicola]|nr:hypothetical protein HZS_4262 [Henneguya salminicola]